MGNLLYNCPYCDRSYEWDACQDVVIGAVETTLIPGKLDKYACANPRCDGAAVAFVEVCDNGATCYRVDDRPL
jgi:hypothetical protein